ncbi:MAG TPA: TRAP transporter TatT component family protein, partial [Blastocatellia bacterium]
MATDDFAEAIERADELYYQRSAEGAVEQSLALLTDQQFESLWRLARAYFFLGQEAASTKIKRYHHASGIEAGRKAVQISAERVEGHFWAGVNLALFAEATGGLKGALSLLHARRVLAHASKIAADYHDAGPLRVLGRLYHKAPRFLGGSFKRSHECFDQALAIAPSNSVTLIYAAELALDLKEQNRATELF